MCWQQQIFSIIKSYLRTIIEHKYVELTFITE